ncbi:MAG: DUF11 domain-containing protein, partial [Williamsia herbipolensis]|nr:DUF11 domain-containing protein [Williamsia herbipolensis]
MNVCTTLAPSAQTTCTASYRVTQDDVDHGSIHNSAVARGTSPNNGPVTSPADGAEVTATPSPQLTLVKSASPGTVTRAGQTVGYAFLVTNTGNVTVDDIAIVDTLTAPAGPEITPSCPVTSLAPQQSVTCTADYRVTADDIDNGAIDNSAVATGATGAGTAVTSTPSTATIGVIAQPAIELVKTATPQDLDGDGNLGAGDTITYTFAVRNTGNVTLSMIGIADPLAGAVNCPADPLAAGDTMYCVIAVDYVITQGDVDAGRVDNSAQVAGTDPFGTTVRDNDTVTTTLAARPSIALAKSGTALDASDNGRIDAGDEVQWTFTVTNTGNVTLHDVAVTDPIAGAVTCPVTTLAPGKVEICRADRRHRLTQADMDAGSVSNTASVNGLPPTGGPVDAPSTATVPLAGSPQLTLDKSDVVTDRNDNGANDAGDSVVWTFLVTNRGNVTVHDIVVDDPGAPRITCPRTTLAPGERMTCRSEEHTITQEESDVGRMVNTATVGGSDPSGNPVTSPPSTAT